MAPRRAEDIPLKRVAAFGCRLPTRLPSGEILTDITKKNWRIGQPVGHGGFGDIYLASDDIHKPVGNNAKFVIKVEPHNNGPLFVEMNFYIRAARKHMIESWCKSQSLLQVGIPTYEGSGSHIYDGQRYRFLVIPRFGTDVGNLFLSNGRKLPSKLVNSLAIQMLYALEYIHGQGYAHADVKGSNILLKRASPQEAYTDYAKTPAYLVDYGLAYRYRHRNGIHKPFVHDERRAHEGTLEFTSRDAHHGTHSRRGDLETLGYNLIQWLCGKLPWEQDNGGLPAAVNPDDIHGRKENFLKNVDNFMKVCFIDKKKIPENLTTYIRYISTLKFESRPDYAYLRSLFKQEIGLECLFGKRMSFPNENFLHMRQLKRYSSRDRRPCRPVNGEARITRNNHPDKDEVDFDWPTIIACHPDKLAKICAQPPSSPLTPPPSPPLASIPTYAMLNVIKKMKDKLPGLFRHRSYSKNADDLKAKWMTPAMEEVALLRQKSMENESKPKNRRILTRSRVAHLKREAVKCSLESDYKPSSKKRKYSH